MRMSLYGIWIMRRRNSEVRRYMEECLFENEHITGVQDLEVSQIKDVLHIKFTLVTDVGSKEVEMDV